MTKTRDEILNILLDIRGVKVNDRSITSEFPDGFSTEVTVLKCGQIDLRKSKDNATLAEAVAALTPPVEPYDADWLESLPQFKHGRTNGMLRCSLKNGNELRVDFRARRWRIASDTSIVHIPVPATKADVLKLLEVFGFGDNAKRVMKKIRGNEPYSTAEEHLLRDFKDIDPSELKAILNDLVDSRNVSRDKRSDLSVWYSKP